MMRLGDNLVLALDSIRAHKLRASLTVLGLTMGVATLITVMTLVQGANLYVEQKIANLGTNVFRIGRLPFAVTDFLAVSRAQRNKFFYPEDVEALAEQCGPCQYVGANLSSGGTIRYKDRTLEDANLYGHTPSMSVIDTRTVELGRYFTDVEDSHAAEVALIGSRVVEEFFPGTNPIGKMIRAEGTEFTVVGTFEKIGSVLGQDQDNYIVIPLRTYLKLRGQRNSLTLHVKAEGPEATFAAAQDDARRILRARRQLHLAVAEHQRGVF
jgi:putative ABC transport system permease protein